MNQQYTFEERPSATLSNVSIANNQYSIFSERSETLAECVRDHQAILLIDFNKLCNYDVFTSRN